MILSLLLLIMEMLEVKLIFFIGLRQLCPKWTPLGPELSVGLREMSITSLIESQIKGVKKGKD